MQMFGDLQELTPGVRRVVIDSLVGLFPAEKSGEESVASPQQLLSSSAALFDLAKREEVQPLLQHQQVFRQAIVNEDKTTRRFGAGRPSTAAPGVSKTSPFSQAKVSKIILAFDRDGAFDYLDAKNKKFTL